MKNKNTLKITIKTIFVQKIHLIPLLNIPQNNDMFIYFSYNPELKAIEIKSFNKELGNRQKYIIDNYPKEKCFNCNCDLMVDNCYYFGGDGKIKFFCSNCRKDDSSTIKLLNVKNKICPENNELLNKLYSYLERNKKNSDVKYIKEMEKLIKLTNTLLYLLSLFENNTFFEKQVLYLENFRSNFLNYLEIVDKIGMNNIYLFLHNLFIISIDKYDKNWLLNFVTYIYKRRTVFNISTIQFHILSNLCDKVFVDGSSDNYFDEVKEEICDLKKIKYQIELNNINSQYSLMQYSIINNKMLSFRKESKIKEIKNKLLDYIRNYYYSFNYVSSKKVLERKLINSIIVSLLKNHNDKFQKVEISENIINSIQKELSGILRYLGNSSEHNLLYNKISNQISYFEQFKREKIFTSYNKNKQLINVSTIGEKVFLTDEDKKVLEKYISESIDDSYTRIITLKDIKPDFFSPEKLQVILEFLFYIRDKTIKTIHILDKSALSFFEYLNKNPFENQEEKKEENSIYNEGEEDDLIEELKIYSQPKYSSDSNSINLNVFNRLKIKSKEEIDLGSALNYIFFYKSKIDYTKEIKYLYDNIVLPLEKITNNKDEQNEMKKNKWMNLNNQIQYIYERIDSLFKKDPFYNDIIKYS